MEMRQLLRELEVLVTEGGRQRYDDDYRYRWVIHRVWIAIGNEGALLERTAGDTSTWRQLRLLRNELAHARLPDIDEDKVWRMTVLRPARLLAVLDDLPV